MDLIDYREKLGMGFSDFDKQHFFENHIFNTLDSFADDSRYCGIGFIEYYNFCNAIGAPINCRLNKDYHADERFNECLRILNNFRHNSSQFLYACIALLASLDSGKTTGFTKTACKNIILKALDYAHILYQVVEDGDDIWVYPKGADELDKSLVSEPLEWLSSYPEARKTYVIALKQYSDGIYIRDVADNLRKALETFLQEFLGNKKNLESNKVEICKYLSSQSVDADIAGLFHPLINAYKNINDRIAKHNDQVDSKLLEFLLYQTGVLIRMVLVVKQAETEAASNAD